MIVVKADYHAAVARNNVNNYPDVAVEYSQTVRFSVRCAPKYIIIVPCLNNLVPDAENPFPELFFFFILGGRIKPRLQNPVQIDCADGSLS